MFSHAVVSSYQVILTGANGKFASVTNEIYHKHIVLTRIVVFWIVMWWSFVGG
jgi:hypothetical protein